MKIPNGLGRQIQKLAKLEKLSVEETAVAVLMDNAPMLTEPFDMGKGKRGRWCLSGKAKLSAKRALRRIV